ncbi:MAG: prephenate dehydrogenase [Anaerolineae bacterium]|nr:prephenate dehydrogenase [Anaerolineae bacterium]
MDDISGFTLTVVGLGLMGGSFAGALKGQCEKIIGVDLNQHTVQRAMERGFIDAGTIDLAEGVHKADVVVLATPVRSIIKLVYSIGSLLQPGCILMDLGSTKVDIMRAMEALPDHVQPLGAHPMCGKEISGIEAADIDLYQGRTFILSPLSRTSEQTLATGKTIASATGAVPLVVEGQRQDFLVGTLSHLPYLIACALISTADKTTSPDPLAWKIVAGGYRDTSRVAGSDVTMMADILSTNREHVLQAVNVYIAQLQHLADLIAQGDLGEQALRETLQYIQATRKEHYP